MAACTFSILLSLVAIRLHSACGEIISIQSADAPSQAHSAAIPGWLNSADSEHDDRFRIEAQPHSYELLGSSLIADDEYPDHLLVDAAIALRGVAGAAAISWLDGAATRKELLRFALLFSHKEPRVQAARVPASGTLLHAVHAAEPQLPTKLDAGGRFDAALHVHGSVAAAVHAASSVNATATLAINTVAYDYELSISSPAFSDWCPSGSGQACRNGGYTRSELLRSNDGNLASGQPRLLAGMVPGYSMQPIRKAATSTGAACDLPAGAPDSDVEACAWSPQPAHASLLGVCRVTYCTTADCGEQFGRAISASSIAQSRSFQEFQDDRPLGLRSHLCVQRAQHPKLGKLQTRTGTVTLQNTTVLHYIMAVHSPTAVFGAADHSLAGSLSRVGDLFEGVHWGVYFAQHAPVYTTTNGNRPHLWIPVNIQSVLADTRLGVPYGLCDGLHVSCPVKGLSAVRELGPSQGGVAARCVHMATGALRCMGSCSSGQCGYPAVGSLAAVGQTMNRWRDLIMEATPPATLPHSVISAASNQHGTCVIVSTGEVYCFGTYGLPVFQPQYGAIGIPDFSSDGVIKETTVPVKILLTSSDVNASPEAVDVSCQLHGCCFLLQGGQVKCFGENVEGSLGFDSSASGSAVGTALGDDEHPWRGPPVTLPGASGASVLACGAQFCCAVLSSTSALHCWGRTNGVFTPMNLDGFVASDFTGAQSPSDVIVDMTATAQKVCVLTAGGTVRCFGHNSQGRLGIGTTSTNPQYAIGEVEFALPVLAFSRSSAGSYHSCALMAYGEVQCWGEGNNFQLGTGGSSDIGQSSAVRNFPLLNTPLQLPVMSVSVTASFTCVVSVSGYTDCFGSNFGSSYADLAGRRTEEARNTAGGIIPVQRMPCALVAAAPLPALTLGALPDSALQTVGNGHPPVYRGLNLTLVRCSERLAGSSNSMWGMRNGSLVAILPGTLSSLQQSFLQELDLGGNRFVNFPPALTSPGGSSVLNAQGWFTFGGSPGGTSSALCLPADVWGSEWEYEESVVVFASTQMIERSLFACNQVLSVSTFLPAALPTRGGLVTLQVLVDQSAVTELQNSLVAHPSIDAVTVGTFQCTGAQWCVVDETVLGDGAISAQCQLQRRRALSPAASGARAVQQSRLLKAAFIQCELGAGSGRDLPVAVTWQGQALSVQGVLSFAAPSLVSAAPAQITTNNTMQQTITLLGENFGDGTVTPTVMFLLPPAVAPEQAGSAQPAEHLGQRRACKDVVVRSHEEISCTWPAGYGMGIIVEVSLSAVVGTGDPGLLRYAPPVVHSAQPVPTAASAALQFVTRGGQRWQVHGEHFGVPTLAPQRWLVVHRPPPMGDFLCVQLTCSSDTLCECDASPEGVGAAHGVSMTVQDAHGTVAPAYSYFPPELLGVFPFDSLPAEGDASSMVVLGTSFGWQDYGASIQVGGQPCRDTTWSALTTDTVLRCPVPPGFGSNIPVRVSVFGQHSSLNPSTFVSYKLPVVSSVEPSVAVLALDSAQSWWNALGTTPDSDTAPVVSAVDILVRGASIAPSADRLLGICLGSMPCSSAAWRSTDLVVCEQESLLHTSMRVGTHPITVLVKSNDTAPGTMAADICGDTEFGQNFPRCTATGVTCVSGGYEGKSRLAPSLMRNFSVMAPPAVTDVVPRLGTPGAQVSILGSDFGWSASDVIDVLFVPMIVGPDAVVKRCAASDSAGAGQPAFSWVSSTTIKCVAPVLPQGSARIMVVSRGGFYNATTGGVRFVTAPANSGSGGLDVDVFSTPASPSLPPYLVNITESNSGQIAIKALLALDPAVLGDSGMDITRFHALLATNVSVLQALTDDEKDSAVATLQADNAPYALFNSAAPGDNRVTVPDLGLGELASYETIEIVQEEQQGLFRLYVVDIAESRAVYVGVLANGTSDSRGTLQRALPVELQAPLLQESGHDSLAALQYSGVNPRLWLQYVTLRTDAPVSAPLHASMRAVNDAEPGTGPWSIPSKLPALPRCPGPDEFLQSHLESTLISCTACPDGAVCSDAEGWEHVRHEEGRFLLRTSPAGVDPAPTGGSGADQGVRIFAPCPIPAACPSVPMTEALLGLQQDVLGASVDAGGIGVSHVVPFGALLAGGTLLHIPEDILRALVPGSDAQGGRRTQANEADAAIPSSVQISKARICDMLTPPVNQPAELVPSMCRASSELSPEAQNTLPVFSVALSGQAKPAYFVALRQPCADGYFGTLCSACDAGYARAPAARECVACAGKAAVYVLLLLGVILGAVVLGYLISSTIASRGRSSALYVSMNKLTLVHLQQISLAASFNLKWPKAMTDLFAGMNAASTVSESTLSTECVSRPFVYESMFLTNTAVTLLLPLVLLVIIFLFWSLRALCCAGSSRSGHKWSKRHHKRGWIDPARQWVASVASTTRRLPAASSQEVGDTVATEVARRGSATRNPLQSLPKEHPARIAGRPPLLPGASIPLPLPAPPVASSPDAGPQRVLAPQGNGPRVRVARHSISESIRSMFTSPMYKAPPGPSAARQSRASIVQFAPVRANGAGPQITKPRADAIAVRKESKEQPLEADMEFDDDCKHSAGEVVAAPSVLNASREARMAVVRASADLNRSPGSDEVVDALGGEDGGVYGMPVSSQLALSVTRLRSLSQSRGMVMTRGRRSSSTLENERTDALTGWIVSAVVASFLLHMTLTRAAAQLVTCAPLTEGDTSEFLIADPNVPCTGEASGFLFGAGAAAFLCYAVGIPALSSAALWAVRSSLEDDTVRQRYGFLYSSYRPHVYFWEVVIMIRKVALTTVAVALAPAGLDIQVIVAVTVLFSAALLHTSVKPYRMSVLNQCELLSLVVAFMTLVGGLLLDSDRVTGHVKQVVTVLLVMQNVLLLVYFFIILMSDAARVTHGYILEFVQAKQEQQAKAERRAPGAQPLSLRTLRFVQWVVETESKRLQWVQRVTQWRVKWCGASVDASRRPVSSGKRHSSVSSTRSKRRTSFA